MAAVSNLNPRELSEVIWTNVLQYFDRVLLNRSDVAMIANDYCAFGIGQGLSYDAHLAKYSPTAARRVEVHAGR